MTMRLYVTNTAAYADVPRPVTAASLAAAAFPAGAPAACVVCVQRSGRDLSSGRCGAGLYAVATPEDEALVAEGDTVTVLLEAEAGSVAGALSAAVAPPAPEVVDRRDASVPPSEAPVVPFRLIRIVAASLPQLPPLDAPEGVAVPPTAAKAQWPALPGCPPVPEPNGGVVPTAEEAEAARLELRPLLDRAKEHRHFYVDLDGTDEERAMYAALERCHELSRRYFDWGPAVKEAIPMDPDTRAWGHHVMGWKRKEILKLRDVPEARARFPSCAEGPSFADFQRCMTAFAAVGNPALEAVCWHQRVPINRAAFFSQAPFGHDDDFSSAFFETFRYAPFGDIAGPAAGPPTAAAPPQEEPRRAPLQGSALRAGDTSKAGVPCELHQDVGGITISPASDGQGGGLQIYSPAQGGWVDGEAPMLTQDPATGAATRRPRVIAFAGDYLEYMTRGRFPAAPHRVVVAPDAAVPRYSTIYEVIPHPQAVVPRAPVDAGAMRDLAPPLRGRDLYVINSVGKSSVNWF